MAIAPVIRRHIGTALGVQIVWSYDARQYCQQGRYRRWHWGLADAPTDRVVLAELIIHLLCIVVVNVLAGLWPVLLLYFASSTRPGRKLMPVGAAHVAGPMRLPKPRNSRRS
jgi:hypothetical protein